MTLFSRNHAVLVNPDADRASHAVVDRINELIDPDDLFVSARADEADALMDHVLGRGYRTVFTAGGDGTVTRLFNHLSESGPRPRIGILPLGSGNGLAELVGGRDAVSDLKTYVDNPSSDSWQLPLCEAEGTRFAFAGLGLDAAVLADFRRVASAVGRGPMRKPLHGLGGYVTALLGVTLPRRAFRPRASVKIVNLGRTAFKIEADKKGVRVGRAYRPGELLYEGPVNATLMGTCPFFGHRFKLLPHAGLDRTRFALRVSSLAPLRMILALRAIHQGRFQHDALHDFHVDKIGLHFSHPMPYQLGGELMGERDRLVVSLAGCSVDLVRFI